VLISWYGASSRGQSLECLIRDDVDHSPCLDSEDCLYHIRTRHREHRPQRLRHLRHHKVLEPEDELLALHVHNDPVSALDVHQEAVVEAHERAGWRLGARGDGVMCEQLPVMPRLEAHLSAHVTAPRAHAPGVRMAVDGQVAVDAVELREADLEYLFLADQLVDLVHHPHLEVVQTGLLDRPASHSSPEQCKP